jgi:GNAT superfamily N-acetyltransferase
VIRYSHDAAPARQQFDDLWRDCWGASASDYLERVLQRSLAHVEAYDEARLVGFVNVAWDGGVHAFVLDTCVASTHRRKGIATELVRIATDLARQRGAEWLHVDFEPHLERFYRACGFGPTTAGLMALNKKAGSEDPAS